MSELFDHVEAVVDEHTRKQKGWPKDAARLGTHIRRIVPVLQARGVLVQWPGERKKGRRVRIVSAENG